MVGDVRKIGWLVGVEAHDKKSAVAEVSVAALAVISSVF